MALNETVYLPLYKGSDTADPSAFCSNVGHVLAKKICFILCKHKVRSKHASTSLPSNTNAPIWGMSIEIHGKLLLGRLLLSYYFVWP